MNQAGVSCERYSFIPQLRKSSINRVAYIEMIPGGKRHLKPGTVMGTWSKVFNHNTLSKKKGRGEGKEH